MTRFAFRVFAVCCGSLTFVLIGEVAKADDLPTPATKALLENRCIDCHGEDEPEGGLNLESILGTPLANISIAGKPWSGN